MYPTNCTRFVATTRNNEMECSTTKKTGENLKELEKRDVRAKKAEKATEKREIAFGSKELTFSLLINNDLTKSLL